MSLSEHDRVLLERLLANEADMAFRRRVPILLDYLELEDGHRILDCGCGMGFWLFAMQRLRRLELVGVDADPARLDWAEREGVAAELVRADAQALPFPDGSFDGVLMSEVLEHLPDDGRALREVRRVLRPGGVLAISVPNARFPFWWDPISATRARLGRPPIRSGPVVGIWTNHERLYTARQLSERVTSAGFEVERIEETTHYCFPFIHFLVYGIGKPLVERNLLPGRLRASADRFRGEANPGGLLDPFNAVRGAFRLVDRLNDRPGVERKRTFLNVLLKARRPAQAQPTR
jgi:SAM-dependent methyltransferase